MDSQKVYNLKSTHTKIQCECGGLYSKSHKLRHFNTRRHKEYKPAGELESFIKEVDDEWEAKKTTELEIKLIQFVKDYEIMSNRRLKMIIEAKKDNAAFL